MTRVCTLLVDVCALGALSFVGKKKETILV